MPHTSLPRLSQLLAALLFCNSAHAATSYSTEFNLTESPISEQGAWSHQGLDWTIVETANGIAFGTQTGTGGFNDSYALLSGFPADHGARGTVHRATNLDPACTHEVEILLRWADAAHAARGYECNVAFDGAYVQIVRWNGGFGNFTYLAQSNLPGGVHSGDEVSASITGQLIQLFVNGREIVRATDSTWATGNPGIGFWRGSTCGFKGDFGFTRFSATSSNAAATVSASPALHHWALIGFGGFFWACLARRRTLQTATGA